VGLAAGCGAQALSFVDSAIYVFSGQLPAGVAWDGLSGATPLNVYKTELGQGAAWSGIQQHSVFSSLGGVGWEWVALLVGRRVVDAVATGDYMAHPRGDVVELCAT